MNIECSIWDKGDDIIKTLDLAKVHFKKEKETHDDKTVTFDDLYTFYLKKTKGEITMSKSYFEKFVETYLEKFVVYSRVISEKWLTNTVLDEINEEIL